MNLYQDAKNMLFHWFVLEIWLIKSSCNLTGWEHFKLSQEENILQIWDLCRNTANNMNFHYRTNSVKMNDQNFSINSKNPISGPFLVHFPSFWGKKIFPRKSGSTMQNFIQVYSTMSKFRKKLMMQFQCLDRQKDGQKDRLTLF